jgi:hypothetical protein
MKLCYAIVDHHGNTFLLQAAQPTKFAQRKGAVEKLMRRITTGTLVVTQNQSDHPPTILQTPDMPETSLSIKFLQVNSDPNPNLHLDFLGVNQEEFVDALLALNHDNSAHSKLIHRLAEEILTYYTETEVIFPSIDGDIYIPPYKEKRQYLTDLCLKLKAEIGLEADITSDGLRQMLEESTNLILGSTRREESLRLLRDATDHYNAAYTLAKEYCMTPIVIKDYLTDIRRGTKEIGYLSLLVYAELHKMNVTIWTKDRNGRLCPLSFIDSENKDPILNLLFTDNNTPLIFLLDISRLTNVDLSQNFAYKLEISREYFVEKNNYGHTILHRAVRSIASDTLVPYILRELEFCNQINEFDIYNKTPLHRAIRYFSEYKKQLLEEFSNHEDFYWKLVDTCLTELLKAGADLEIKKSGETPLQRADLYNNIGGPFAPLAKWLVTQHNELFPDQPILYAPPANLTAPVNTTTLPSQGQIIPEVNRVIESPRATPNRLTITPPASIPSTPLPNQSTPQFNQPVVATGRSPRTPFFAPQPIIPDANPNNGQPSQKRRAPQAKAAPTKRSKTNDALAKPKPKATTRNQTQTMRRSAAVVQQLIEIADDDLNNQSNKPNML